MPMRIGRTAIRQKPNPTTDDMSGERVYRLSSFYSVIFSETGEILDINNAASIGVSDEELIGLANQLSIKRKTSGVKGRTKQGAPDCFKRRGSNPGGTKKKFV